MSDAKHEMVEEWTAGASSGAKCSCGEFAGTIPEVLEHVASFAEPAKPMTKGEREELKRLARERARVAKSDAQRRSADLKAMFEHQLMESYSFNSEETWSAAVDVATEECSAAQEKIRERCDELGIPTAMHPRVGFDWQTRGPFQVAANQQNLRRTAHQRIAAQERSAIAEIDRAALDIQTNLVRAGLTSDAALDFLSAMPSVNDLMPPVVLDELEQPRPRPPRELGMGDDTF